MTTKPQKKKTISKSNVKQSVTSSAAKKSAVISPPAPKPAPPRRVLSAPGNKRRVAVSQKNLSQDVQDVMRERFPRGYVDYMDQIIRVDKPDGSFFYAITLEVEDAIYLVKIDVPIDTDYEEVEKKLFGGGHGVNDDGQEPSDSEDDDKDFMDDDVPDDE
ncbi:MAG: hypothetical protein LBD91_07075 [Prevotellaceae bacterium]|jgi:hypothetical protein|nr:hypothetical protein [Prevotellaceae bacterium]